MKPYEEELAYRWLNFVHSLGGEDEYEAQAESNLRFELHKLNQKAPQK